MRELLVLLGVLLCVMSPVMAQENATEIAIGSTTGGYINPAYDIDWYAFNVSEGPQLVSVDLDVPAGVDYDLYIYGPDAQDRLFKTSIHSGDERVLAVFQPGRYYAKVKGHYSWHWSDQDAYTLRVYNATRIGDNEAVQEFIGYEGDIDWYVLESDNSSLRLLLGVPYNQDYDLAVYGPRDLTFVTDRHTNGIGINESIFLDETAAGHYFIKVYGHNTYDWSGDVPYTLSVGREIGNPKSEDPVSAETLVLGTSVQRYLSTRGDEDWYTFHINQTSYVSVELGVPEGVDYDLYIYGPDKEERLFKSSGRSGHGVDERVLETFITGTYYVKVRGRQSWDWSDTSSYSLKAYIPPPPSVSILHPSGGSSYIYGEGVKLMGSGSDSIDGEIRGASLKWSSNRDGALGTGREITADLSIGHHTITLTASNSRREETSASVSVHVFSPPVLIDSTPTGAEVYINYGYVGKTPVNLTGLHGSYSVKLSKEGYEEIEKEILFDDTGFSFSFSLIPLPREVIDPPVSAPLPPPPVEERPREEKVIVINEVAPAEGPKPKLSVHLHTDKTTLRVGETSGLALSAVNPITNLPANLQVILKVAPGVSVSSSYFAETGSGQYTLRSTILPGESKQITADIVASAPGNFSMTGEVVYYFGENRTEGGRNLVELPLVVVVEDDGTPPHEVEEVPQGICGPSLIMAISILPIFTKY